MDEIGLKAVYIYVCVWSEVQLLRYLWGAFRRLYKHHKGASRLSLSRSLSLTHCEYQVLLTLSEKGGCDALFAFCVCVWKAGEKKREGGGEY